MNILCPLRNNRLSSLPDGLSSCVQLRTIIIEHNQFTMLPPVLYQLKAMESILAANNQVWWATWGVGMRAGLMCVHGQIYNSVHVCVCARAGEWLTMGEPIGLN